MDDIKKSLNKFEELINKLINKLLNKYKDNL